ncbi:MAG: glycine hydroxymethyltransferase [Candidatus Hydrogenedentes bacterium]|nr:glycine hydroxymethyltransferase [Candidatus Hydrogenedentota bacterium]
MFSNSALHRYLHNQSVDSVDPTFLAYLANLSVVASDNPEVAAAIVQELEDQRRYLKLIASENYCSPATQLAMGNLLTDKYAEGVPFQRFYEGCDNVDYIEDLASKEACTLFGAEHAYVQPHSGADANMVAFWAILTARVEVPSLEKLGITNPAALSNEDWNKVRDAINNQRLLGMDYYSGGHLTHGYRRNLSGKMFESFSYTVNRETGWLDYDEIEAMALELRPLILLAGYSAYPRRINFKRMREIADKVNAVFMVDMAHFAGLVAGGVFQGEENPVPYAHIVTSTTHKTLRGPRSGFILCQKEFAEYVDKGCPLVLGGPLPHVLAAKAVAFREANRPEYKQYAQRVVENSRALAKALTDRNFTLATGGTDNHLLLIDVAASCGLTGAQAAAAIRACGITLNFNSLPFDANGPLITSGLRLGTAAITTLGMTPAEMEEIAALIRKILDHTKPALLKTGNNAGKPSKRMFELDQHIQQEVLDQVKQLLDRFPVYPMLNLAVLKEYFPAPEKE